MSTPYSVRSETFYSDYLRQILALSRYHIERCQEYRRMCTALFPNFSKARSFSDLPFVPATLFKDLYLSSVPESEILRTMISSGTSGVPSRIALDRETSIAQSRLLAQIMKFWIGSERLPLLIIDSPSILGDRERNSARAAAAIGMMQFSSSHCWLLDEDGNQQVEVVRKWLSSHQNRRVFVFGFTGQIWKNLVVELPAQTLNLRAGILIHGGGWKKMKDRSVSREEFRMTVRINTGISEIHDYYGMVEQLGSVWFEVSEGVFVPSSQSHVIVRDPDTLEPCPQGEVGLLQLLSLLPKSYPGHSILTEDLGYTVRNRINPEIFGELGISLVGRLPRATSRGCSDAVSS